MAKQGAHATPLHDWTRVEPFLFHAFYHTWLGGLCQALNASVRPAHLYALVEQPSLGASADEVLPDFTGTAQPPPPS